MGSLGTLVSLGSLFLGSSGSSGSKPAPAPAPVANPAPVSTPAPAAQTPSTPSGADTQTPAAGSGAEQPSAEPTPEEARTDNLLRRSRGRFGTVQTSFRGLLSPAATSGQRKTLLGE